MATSRSGTEVFRNPRLKKWHIYREGFYWWAVGLCGYSYNGYNTPDPEYRRDAMPEPDRCKHCRRIWEATGE